MRSASSPPYEQRSQVDSAIRNLVVPAPSRKPWFKTLGQIGWRRDRTFDAVLAVLFDLFRFVFVLADMQVGTLLALLVEQGGKEAAVALAQEEAATRSDEGGVVESLAMLLDDESEETRINAVRGRGARRLQPPARQAVAST